jgi:hypothetical protein
VTCISLKNRLKLGYRSLCIWCSKKISLRNLRGLRTTSSSAFGFKKYLFLRGDVEKWQNNSVRLFNLQYLFVRLFNLQYHLVTVFKKYLFFKGWR